MGSFFTLGPSVTTLEVESFDSLFGVAEGCFRSSDVIVNGSEFSLEVGEIGVGLGEDDD